MNCGVRHQKTVPHELHMHPHEAPLGRVTIDAPSTRLSLSRLVPTRADLRFTEHQHATQNHIEHHSPCLEKSRGFGGWPQVRATSQNGIRKSFSESVLTKSKTIADPFSISPLITTNSEVAVDLSVFPRRHSFFFRHNLAKLNVIAIATKRCDFCDGIVRFA